MMFLNNAGAISAALSSTARVRGATRSTSVVIRMCSPRPMAVHRAQHDEPEKCDRRKFVSPGQRPVEGEARRHAGEEDSNLPDDVDHGAG